MFLFLPRDFVREQRSSWLFARPSTRQDLHKHVGGLSFTNSLPLKLTNPREGHSFFVAIVDLQLPQSSSFLLFIRSMTFVGPPCERGRVDFLRPACLFTTWYSAWLPVILLPLFFISVCLRLTPPHPIEKFSVLSRSGLPFFLRQSFFDLVTSFFTF